MTTPGRARPGWRETPATRFAVDVIRGVGQVDLQAKALVGLGIVVALFSAGWQYGVFGLLGSAVSTGTAVLLGVARKDVYLGLEGFSGCLAAIACYLVFGNDVVTWILAAGAAIACAIVTAALASTLATWRIPGLTAPFCAVAGALALGAPSFTRIWSGPSGELGSLPVAASGSAALSWGDLGTAFFTNISQIFLIDKWWAGLIMLVALCFGGLKVAVAAASASVLAIFVAWAMGAPSDMVHKGLYGYSAVLVGIALAATFLAVTLASVLYTAFAVGVSVVLTASVTIFFSASGGHTYTWPFVLTTWVFVAAASLFPALRRIA